MKKIASFTIDHIKLQPGIYVSRKDFVGREVITTFDLRMTSPNEEPVMNTAEVHTIEHLGATFLRNYVSRKDFVGREVITTFDLRMTSPNEEPVMNTAEVHTIEHLGATFLRNHKDFSDKVIYFGPMGCRTGFYLLLAGDYESKDIVPLITEMFIFIRDFHDEVPGASAKDCGNYLDMNLNMANWLADRYLNHVLFNISEERLVYPK